MDRQEAQGNCVEEEKGVVMCLCVWITAVACQQSETAMTIL